MHGSVVGIANSSGSITKTYAYDAFGVELSPVASDTNPFRYSGEYFDAETGDYYLRARYYNPRLGRFLTEDPVRDGNNWYVYCNNNPVRYVDPSGEIAITTLILIGSAVIALVAAGATAYDSYNTTGKVDWVNTITTGLTWFTMAYTLGTAAYGLYLSYCAYKGITPVAEVKFNSNTEIGSNPASAGKGAQTNIKADNSGKQVEAVSKGGSKTVNPNDIRFCQSSVNGSAEIAESMKINGWDGDPIDVVKMPDGGLTTIDNTRVVAARQAGIDVQANIHTYDELLPSEYVDRFTTKMGVPKTWGDAITFRIGNQNATFRNNNPYGSVNMQNIK